MSPREVAVSSCLQENLFYHFMAAGTTEKPKISPYKFCFVFAHLVRFTWNVFISRVCYKWSWVHTFWTILDYRVEVASPFNYNIIECGVKHWLSVQTCGKCKHSLCEWKYKLSISCSVLVSFLLAIVCSSEVSQIISFINQLIQCRFWIVYYPCGDVAMCC